ncbi:type II toxin-antitoxin system VapC family toxin [Turneriella parva]|uniref:Ribonuclease VapC n=1 Tax=Turneriella parva (strain ATCC BAA-1111 / DSM 21527 / NCTC 11395 / H) TaxID=869212 RepID=I4B1N7_TURPD|nr:PIN domain nuclease [Turneriella parva]AFM11194.1 PilT protein domain protein [Turneriella parva DSM 21527]
MSAPVLVDTSAWIDYLLGRESETAGKMNELLSNDQVVICPLIVQEILQGLKSQQEFDHTKLLLSSMPRLHFNPYDAAEGAANLYRTLRRQGITIRKTNDCLIAWYALQAGCAVLHRDRDFDLMAKPLKLKVLKK